MRKQDDAVERLVASGDNDHIVGQGSQFLEEAVRLTGQCKLVPWLEANLLHERFPTVTGHDAAV